MNTVLKNALMGCALVGICFGLGRGVKWIQNHDWSTEDNEETQIERLERRVNRLEYRIDKSDDSTEQLERKLNRLENTLNRNDDVDIRQLERKLNQLENKLDRNGDLDLRQLERKLNRVEYDIRRLESKQQLLSNLKRMAEENGDDDDDDDDDDSADKKEKYKGKPCHSQRECGGKDSGYFCNYGGMHSKNVCEKTNPLNRKVNGETYYYNKLADLKKWCRPDAGSPSDRANPDNCNWGYLSYSAAQAWCESIGKELVNPNTIHNDCDDFYFLPDANDDQQYWTADQHVVHMGDECSIQQMVRGDGYSNAGGVICK